MKTLETKRLILRNWKLTDVEDLYEYAKNPLVGTNAGWLPHKNINESKKNIEIFIKEDNVYAIVLKSTNKVIGSLGIHGKSNDSDSKKLKHKTVGYVLNPKYWGNGYVPEALKFIIKYCFEEKNIDLIWCDHFEGNNNSKRVLQKCNFEYKFSRVKTLELFNNKKINCLFYNLSKKNYSKGVSL